MSQTALEQLPEEHRYDGRTGQLITEQEAIETLRRLRDHEGDA